MFAVSAAHGLVLLALLQTQGIMPRLDRARDATRLDVVLLESTVRENAPVAPLIPSFEAPMAVEPPELPVIEAEPVEPSTEERLQGLYVGQVRARISRAWEALGPVPSPALPDCQIRVTQSNRGEVLEVTVSECTLDASARAQLVRAVRAAGPLPAPPASLATQSIINLRLAATR